MDINKWGTLALLDIETIAKHFCRGQMEDECHKLARPLRCKCFGSQHTFEFNFEKLREILKILKELGTHGSQVQALGQKSK